jgi:YD repeat-containing protein
VEIDGESPHEFVSRKIVRASSLLFGYDGTGRLTTVTNALSKITSYQYDEAGNEIAQIDALNRTNSFAYDGMGRRISHTMPTNALVEQFSYDLAGNLIYDTNFNGVVITNQYDVMNRLTNQISVNGYQVSYTYTPTGQRQSMIDMRTARRFIVGNAVGDLIFGIILVFSGNGASAPLTDHMMSFGIILAQWIPVFIVYGVLIIVVLKRLKISELIGIVELCGFCVGLFPVPPFGALWPNYAWRWDLALFYTAIQCAFLSAIIFLRWLFYKALHR